MTVLVTGANGFVGSHVVRQLVASGAEVVALVRPSSSLARLEGISVPVNVERADLADIDQVQTQLNRIKPTRCIHVAWYAEPGKCLDARENLDSLRFSLDLIEALAKAGCQHVVGVGTCFEYAMGTELLTEDSRTAPRTLYAAAKLAFSLVAAQRLARLGIPMAWARLFYMYGPYEDERRLVPAAIRALTAGREFPCTSGEQVRDYLHVEDVASAISALSLNSLNGSFNVSSGQPETLARMMQELGELMGRPDLIRLGALPNREWDPQFVGGDSQRLRREAHWSPRYGLRDGLAATVEWWKRQASATPPAQRPAAGQTP